MYLVDECCDAGDENKQHKNKVDGDVELVVAHLVGRIEVLVLPIFYRQQEQRQIEGTER